MPDTIRPGMVVSGPVLPEPLEILAVTALGTGVRLIGRGVRTGLARDIVLTPDQVAQLELPAARQPFDGDARLFRLGIEAARLGLAHEYDPFFSLSIARVDPLPHQLEAVYNYFLKLPRLRFLLADDAGAGKTIMAGLLLKELKARGLVARTLIVAPANLTFQWQRELKDKFSESFEVLRSDVLRANYGQNPWQERSQLITSISWVSRIDDARESLLRSHWDLIIVDEAHKMAAYADDRKTLAYKLGEALSSLTDHYLLMTATPHKGDPENFCRFLALLDRDVYGSVQSLQEAMRKNEAPFYLRRTKEALVSFPDPETGEVRRLFTKREVRTAAFDLDGPELQFYDALTHYVEDQSILAAQDDSARSRAVGFTMAMLQRRMASTIYAVRRTLERMRAKRELVLTDPEKFRREQIERRLPDDFDDLPEDEQQEIIAELEDAVASFNPADLRLEIAQLSALIDQARALEGREVESKLAKLKAILQEEGVFSDPKTKLLVFTEHKDSLDFLAGDGENGRPLGKLREWGLAVTQIHGGMKIGDRDTEGSRIWAEKEFREHAQVLVATEAAGEGINLQFCWLMVNYDIPWNPMRLEQRAGRIHRYGQEHDCLIFNFAAVNTREGRVLQKLLDRLREIRRELGTDQVFDVVGEVFPSNLLERLFRELYARRLDVPGIEDRIVREVNPARFRAITDSALEGLARRSLNLSAIVGKSVEARERRLVPEVIEQFFLEAAPVAGIHPRPTGRDTHIYRIGRLPRTLLPLGDRLEPKHGRLGREYGRVVFDKALLKQDATLEWVTPGHPLFEVVREDVGERVQETLRRGAVFYDLNRAEPSLLDVFAASVKDGRGQCLHRRLWIVETSPAGEMTVRQPTLLLDVIAAPPTAHADVAERSVPDQALAEQVLYEEALEGWLQQIVAERTKEVTRVAEHVRISLDALIDRQSLQFAELHNRQIEGQTVAGLDGLIAQAEQHLDELNNRRDRRLRELEMERHCTVGDLTHLGRAWVLPHPERTNPALRSMVRDDEIEQIAVRVAIDYEEARGCVVEDVQADNRGFDLISRLPHPDDPTTFREIRFIEVKGRAGIGEVALSANEYRTAERLKQEYWLHAVFNCGSTPELSTVQNPANLDWKPVVTVEHYTLKPDAIRSEQRT
jgi:superfamily II DNA or RNA helicase